MMSGACSQIKNILTRPVEFVPETLSLPPQSRDKTLVSVEFGPGLRCIML